MLVNDLCGMAELTLYVEQPVGEDYDIHKFEPLQHGQSSTEHYDYPFTDQQQSVHSGTSSSSYSHSKVPVTTGISELPDDWVSPRMFAENIVMSPGTYSEIPPEFSFPQTDE